MQPLALLLAASVVVGCETAQPAKVPATAKPAADMSETLPRALPGVLLVVNRRTDGQTGFGAAVLLPGDFALTNRHVVEKTQSLLVMFYDPARASNSGLEEEGGLRRYLFEYEKELVRAEVVREDAALDFAVIRIHKDTSAYPRLPWRTEPAKIGERVFAVGHPAQNVWSFTTGLVSNTHVRAIQVDAAINEGNSGGPLLDSQGRVLGINTLRALGNVQGIGYARPIALAESVVGTGKGVTVDLSSPDKASVSCSRAVEVASESLVDCEDLEEILNLTEIARERALDEVGRPPFLVELLKYSRSHPPRSELLLATRRRMVATLRGTSMQPSGLLRDAYAATMNSNDDVRAVRAAWSKASPSELAIIRERGEAAKKRWLALAESFPEDVAKRTGVKKEMAAAWLGLAPLQLDALRMGHRVERVVKIDPAHAWVVVSGLNKDGTRFQYSEFWTAVGGQWRESHVPTPELAQRRPVDLPPSPIEYETFISLQRDLTLMTWAGNYSAPPGWR